MTHSKPSPPRFACAACGAPVDPTCRCGRVSAAWATAEEVIVLRARDLEAEPPSHAEQTVG
jgi:hypothetical protein